MTTADSDDNTAERSSDRATNPPTLAATVVPLRFADGFEVLMLQRQRSMAFAAGAWVFPGGRVDLSDVTATAAPSQTATAIEDATGDPLWRGRAERLCATRECEEEAGFQLDPSALIRLSHWTPPPESPTRYSTAFFVAIAPDVPVTIDHESAAFRWLDPLEALTAHRDGTFELTPPTVITLLQLRALADPDASGHVDRDAFIGRLASAEVEHFATRIGHGDDSIVAMYHGDAGYDSGNAETDGPRHRLTLGAAGWAYQRDVVTASSPLPSSDG